MLPAATGGHIGQRQPWKATDWTTARRGTRLSRQRPTTRVPPEAENGAPRHAVFLSEWVATIHTPYPHLIVVRISSGNATVASTAVTGIGPSLYGTINAVCTKGRRMSSTQPSSRSSRHGQAHRRHAINPSLIKGLETPKVTIKMRRLPDGVPAATGSDGQRQTVEGL